MPRLARESRYNPDQLADVPGAHPVSHPGAVTGDIDMGITSSGDGMRTLTTEEEPHSAHLINDEEQHNDPTTTQDVTDLEVFEGKVVEDNPCASNTQKGNWVVIAIAFTACLVLLILMLTLLLPKLDAKQEATAPDGSSTLPETNSTTSIYSNTSKPAFHDHLPFSVLDSVRKEAGSPLWSANQWMLADPNLHTYSPERQLQRFYLVFLYFTTNGDTWIRNDHWLDYTVPECQWFSNSTLAADSKYYIHNVCDKDEAFIRLSLSANNLTGNLPIYYTDFIPKLKVFDIGGNHIGDAMYPITNTPYLEVYITSYNLFEGAFVFNAGAEFENLKFIEMRWLKVRGNNGGAANYMFPMVESLDVTGLDSDGELWTSLGLLTNLEYLRMGHRYSTHGTIPSELGRLTALKELSLESLPLIFGTIPSELGLLSELTKLNVLDTPISGSLPVEFCPRIARGQLKVLADCDGGLLNCCI